jgi:signal transduction histidine kinase
MLFETEIKYLFQPETGPAAASRHRFVVIIQERQSSIAPTKTGGPHRLIRSARLTQFGASLLRMQDEDRRRIARELHSTTSQRLAALQLNLALVARCADALDPRAQAALSASVDLVRTCAREIRAVSYRLHPPLLDEFGLSAALRSFAEEYTQRTGIGIELHLPETLDRMPHDVEIGIFRIVQESIADINLEMPVTLRVERDPSRVLLELISPSPMPPRDPVTLAAMHERARQLNGRLVIQTGRAGVTLRLKIPLRRSSAKGASV